MKKTPAGKARNIGIKAAKSSMRGVFYADGTNKFCPHSGPKRFPPSVEAEMVVGPIQISTGPKGL